jgi:ABC-type multidrug transport system fused ATPase/permease subunit
LLAVFVAKNAFGVALLEIQARCTRRLQVQVARRMLRGYLAAPYPVHLQRNSTEMIRAVLSDLSMLTNSVLTPCLALAAEAPVAILIGAVLLYASPVAAAAALVMGGVSSWVFYRVVRVHVAELGRTVQLQGQRALQDIIEALGGIRETKLYGAETAFCERMVGSLDRTYRAQYRLAMITQLPRYFNETIAIIGVLVFTFVTLAFSDRSALLPLLALFAVAAVRLVPSMNRIVSSLTQLRSALPSLDKIHQELAQFAAPPIVPVAPSPPAPFERFEAKDLRFAYPGAPAFLLEVGRFEIRPGERVALTGSSGSGKSTFIDVLTGLLAADSGQLLCNGVSVDGDVAAWQRRIGYVSQQIHLLDDTILRNVAFAVPDDEVDPVRVEEALRAAHIADFVAALPGGVQAAVGELGARLSGGQRQRLGIARALYRRPEILILDEGTSALDAETEAQIARTLRELSGRIAILVIAHRLSTIRDFDRIVFMDEGRLVASGSFSEVAAKVPEFQRMLEIAGLSAA